MEKRKYVITPIGRLSYPHLFHAQTMKNDDGTSRTQWSCNLIFPTTADLTELKQECRRVAVARWEDKLPTNLRLPFRDNAEYGENGKAGYTEPGTFVAFKCDRAAPAVINGDRSPITAASGLVYPGCYGRVSCAAYAWANPKGGKGVSFSLIAFQKTGDGEPLGGDVPYSDDMFDAVDPSEATIDDIFG